MQNKNLVSVGIPVYNSEKTILKSIKSILQQSYKKIEIIVSDNNSEDRSYYICKKLSKKDKRIKLFRQKTTLDPIKNFLFVYKKSKGNYFMWHPSHYFRSKNFIKKNLEILKANNDIIGSCSKELFFDEVKKRKWTKFSLEGNTFHNLKILIKNIYRSHGIFYSLYKKNKNSPANKISNYIAHDWNFCIDMILQGKIKRINSEYTLIGRGTSTKSDYFKKTRKNFIEIFFPFYFFLKKSLKQLFKTKKLKFDEKVKIILILLIYLSILTLNYYKKFLKKLIFRK